MEMRVVEDLSTGQDLNPPLKALAFVLHDRYLLTHCSACFDKLPADPFSSYAPNFPQSVPNDDAHILYCSTRCSFLDSALHFSSAEAQLHSVLRQASPSTWREENTSSDLRLSLRLSRRFADAVGRDGKNSVFGGIDEYPVRENMDCEDESFSGRIAGVQRLLLGGERRTNPHQDSGDLAETRELERIGGLMSNRERLMIQEYMDDDDDEGGGVVERIFEGANMMAKARRLCRDAAAASADDDHREFMNEDSINDEISLCIVMTNAVEVQDDSGLSIGVAVYSSEFSWINHSCSPNACYQFLLGMDKDDANERNSYGPRVIVRSIKPIKKGEEVTIAYTDLLQPKNMRKAELWLKYRFTCRCNRCEAMPTSSVDSALQMLIVDSPNSPDRVSCLDHEELMDIFDEAMSEYLQRDDPKSCIMKLEILLSHAKSEDKSTPLALKLHPFNHISLNAYTTLSSAYKVLAINLLSDDNELNGPRDEAFLTYKTSAAYSLLAALATNHLFAYEPSLITSVANFMKDAGESLLKLTTPKDFSYITTYKCSRCSLTGTLTTDSISREGRDFYSEEVKGRLVSCISSLASKAWSPLAAGSSFLGLIEDPFSFLNVDVGSQVEEPGSITESLTLETDRQVLLGIHCLRYGALLSNICYG